MMMLVVSIRPAETADRPFLTQMLAVAADWRSKTAAERVEEIVSKPAIARYLHGWPAGRDFGVVAFNDKPVGAAWWRYFDPTEPGYGFIDASTPELAVGVIPERRGRQVGTRLLQALLAEARIRKIPALSLSVARDNPAVHLYERLGFTAVDDHDGSITMVAITPS
jgi:ribosomal protein S18 acetylase RimI-like enzyme